MLLWNFLNYTGSCNGCSCRWHHRFLNYNCRCRRKLLDISHRLEVLLNDRSCLWCHNMSRLSRLLNNVSVHLMNNWLVYFVDNVTMNFMNHRLMNLANFLFINDWLMMLMNNRLDMLMNDFLVVFMNHLLMVFVDYIPMRFLNYRCINFLDNPRSISLYIYNRGLWISR